MAVGFGDPAAALGVFGEFLGVGALGGEDGQVGEVGAEVYGELTDEQKTANKAHNSKRAVGERGNSLLKTTFKALRRISLCPYEIGAIVAAALALLHLGHGRTT